MQQLATNPTAKQITYGNLPQGAEALVLAELQAKTILHISVSDKDMSRLAEGLKFFAPNTEVIEFPAWDILPYDRSSPNQIIVARRIEALCKLSYSKPSEKRIILTTVNAVLQKLPKPEVFKTSALVLEKGASNNRQALLNYLQKNGYDRVSKVMQAGEYAVRGSIIDLFPSGHDEGIRIDYFGEDIETIKTFEPLSQASVAEIPKFQLLPASEIIFDDETREKFRSNYRKLFGAVLKEDPLYESVSQGVKYPGMENWLPLFYDEMATIFDYIPADTLLAEDHEVEHTYEQRIELIHDYYDARKGTNYKPLPANSLYLTDENSLPASFNKITLTPFSNENSIDGGYRKITWVQKESGKEFDRIKDIKKAVYISCFSQGSLEHIKTILKNHGISSEQIQNWASNKHKPQTTSLFVAPIEQGFENDNFIIVSEQDIFGDRFIRSVKKKKSTENFFAEAAGFSVGELIVHEEHGIGKFAGLETLEVNGIRHDMVKLIYDGGDRMFVPVENIEVISRYGSDEENVRLDKLGGVAWQERKSKLKERIKLAADALLKIAAERALKEATKYMVDAASYEEFVAKFPYTETDDQLRAIEEVFIDLSSGKPMDRLICGDVGFGKTEVALRAAYLVGSA